MTTLCTTPDSQARVGPQMDLRLALEPGVQQTAGSHCHAVSGVESCSPAPRSDWNQCPGWSEYAALGVKRSCGSYGSTWTKMSRGARFGSSAFCPIVETPSPS